MSYYNEMYCPEKDVPFDEEDMVFLENENGFENMVKLIGEEFVSIIDDKKAVIFKRVHGGTDGIRPYELDWQWHDNETFYSHADCFIFVHDMHNRIDWSKIEDIESKEKSLSLYQGKVKKYGNKLVIFPV